MLSKALKRNVALALAAVVFGLPALCQEADAAGRGSRGGSHKIERKVGHSSSQVRHSNKTTKHKIGQHNPKQKTGHAIGQRKATKKAGHAVGQRRAEQKSGKDKLGNVNHKFDPKKDHKIEKKDHKFDPKKDHKFEKRDHKFDPKKDHKYDRRDRDRRHRRPGRTVVYEGDTYEDNGVNYGEFLLGTIFGAILGRA